MAESVISLFKTELPATRPCWPASAGWKGLDDLEVETCGWVSWFNTERFHGELGDLTPSETEDRLLRCQPSGPRSLRTPTETASIKPRPNHVDE